MQWVQCMCVCKIETKCKTEKVSVHQYSCRLVCVTADGHLWDTAVFKDLKKYVS